MFRPNSLVRDDTYLLLSQVIAVARTAREVSQPHSAMAVGKANAYSHTMKTNIEVLKAVITRVLARYPAVQAVYLFGSHADGCANAQSDLDLGVVGSPEVLALDRVSMLAEFVNEGFDRVDLVFLDQADLVVRFEAVRRNCLLFRTPEFDHGSYVSRNLREYFDFEPYLKTQRLALKERLLSGSA